jgi:hypothetical protein
MFTKLTDISFGPVWAPMAKTVDRPKDNGYVRIKIC